MIVHFNHQKEYPSLKNIQKIVFYGRRNTGMYILAFLVAKGYEVKVISDDANVLYVANSLGLDVVNLETMGDFDLFICCHGIKIIDSKYLIPGKFINVHPCLYKYKGHNPIKRYIENKDRRGSVESHFMMEEVDSGEVIHSEYFETPVITTFAEYYNIALPYYFKCIERTLNVLQTRNNESR